jgi:hypothetical protein
VRRLLSASGLAVTSLFPLALALGLGACLPPPPVGPPPPNGVTWAADTDVAWTEMQRALAGRWKATTPQNRSIAVTYRVVSNGSALVETFTSTTSGKETLSVYHRDGHTLMLTHYCAQGNQARLKAIEATKDRIVFSYLDATNLGEEQDLMQRLAIVLRPDGFDQETAYRLPNGEQETTTLRFFRAE